MSDRLQDCPAGQCPPQCQSVFDRVVVSHIIRGPTRVMWDLLGTFTDANPLEFQLQVGRTSNPMADDWEDVGLPVVNQYVAYDTEQRVWGKTNYTHYRVMVTSPGGVYYSLPTGGMGTLDRRSWRLARDIIRSRLIKYKQPPGGQRGFLLKRRWAGQKCRTCLDYMTEESRNPDCPTCYGTGFECGYYYPVNCVWAEFSPRTRRTHLDSGQSRGTIEDIVVQADMIMTELMGEEDVWVNLRTDDRYYIHTVQHTGEVRGVPVCATVEMRPIPFTSAIYAIEIPEQLRAIGLDD